MILVTRLNGVEQFFVNEDKIEFIEETPDTVISLESGKKIVVMESAADVIRRIIEFRQTAPSLPPYRRRTQEG